MPNTYREAVGKEFHFNKGDQAPEWLFTGEVSFGADTKVVCRHQEIYFYAKKKLGPEDCVIRAVSVDKQHCPKMRICGVPVKH